MFNIQVSWKPQKRKTKYPEKPDWVPTDIYNSAVSAKRTYNEGWDYWVW